MSKVFDLEMIQKVYSGLSQRVKFAKAAIGRPLTYSEKILYAHLSVDTELIPYERGKDFVDFAPDRVAMQDATAQMALLQFMQAGRNKVAVPSTVHCDHLIQAKVGASEDLAVAKDTNKEVYNFLESVSNKYGIGFWKPGAGIIHQVVLENYAFPGGMIIGTDSHTVNAGGLGMIAIGVGGADACDVMAGLPWECLMPKLIGVKLTGQLNGWTSSKDVILKVAGILTASGGTNAIVEYFGPGAESLSCTGKGTICNMGAEVGATTSIFGYDDSMARYLRATGRSEVADLANAIAADLTGDPQVYANPEKYFDQVIEINLSTLEPHLNGPLTPDLATPISQMVITAIEKGWPTNISACLIGSCTNSSYEDIARASSIAQFALDNGLELKVPLTITPGSELVRFTAEKDGLLQPLLDLGATVLANACGPCIGMWARVGAEKQERNIIVHSFNRNFAKRADGNPNTLAFVGSPELVVALALSGDLRFNPILDMLTNEQGNLVKLVKPKGDELPENGFIVEDAGYQTPAEDGSSMEVIVSPTSDRLQLLEPFTAPVPTDFEHMEILIKVTGKCTTDHISMAGSWLKYRGHLDNISDNLLIGAKNAFTGDINKVLHARKNYYGSIPQIQREYQKEGVPTIVFGEWNYGEGSSREHAAMEPRFLGVKAVIVKSFARIHETNLKKQGVLALTFSHPDDYDKIEELNEFRIFVYNQAGEFIMKPGVPLQARRVDANGNDYLMEFNHTYNDQQIAWFRAGAALNCMGK